MQPHSWWISRDATGRNIGCQSTSSCPSGTNDNQPFRKRVTNVGARPTIGTYHAKSVAIINMKSIKCNKSSAIQGLWVYPLEGKCSVQYNDGNIYEYSNVSRRAIFSIITNDKQSVGKWVNHNCKTKGVACEWTGHESPWIPCVDELTPQLPNFI